MVPAEGFTMVCISLERTQGVRFPLTRAKKASTIKKIGAIWCLALLLDLPGGFLFYQYDPAIDSFLKCRNVCIVLETVVCKLGNGTECYRAILLHDLLTDEANLWYLDSICYLYDNQLHTDLPPTLFLACSR